MLPVPFKNDPQVQAERKVSDDYIMGSSIYQATVSRQSVLPVTGDTAMNRSNQKLLVLPAFLV